MKKFKNRQQAAQELIHLLKENGIANQAIIIALPRGGVPIGFHIANHFHLSLDVIIVRKIGHPHNPEFALGAIAEPDIVWWNQEALEHFNLTPKDLSQEVATQTKEVTRRIDTYRQGQPLTRLKDKQVIIVDDGLATGATAMAAIKAIKNQQPNEIIFASPVCAAQSAVDIHRQVDHLICAHTPHDLRAIGQYYQDFSQVSDAEVNSLLEHQPSS